MKYLLILLIILLPGPLWAKDEVLVPRVNSEKADFQVVRVAKGLTSPWGMAFLPDGSLLGTLRTGGLFLYREGKIQTLPLGLKVDSRGQGGLLDLVLHPDFSSNSQVYLTYSLGGPSGSSAALARGIWTGNGIKDILPLWNDQAPSSTTHHYGSRLVFGADKMLYVTLGERGEQNRAQNTLDSAGKVLRLTPEGKAAPGNPFLGNKQYYPGLFTLGHRNAQGLALRPGTSELWLSEHGPKGGDEINLLKAGANYGWPLVTFGVNYNGTAVSKDTQRPGLEPPIINWVPSIAPSGLGFYSGSLFPGWKGNLFSGALAGQELKRMEISPYGTITSQETLLKNKVGRIRDLEFSPDGLIYLVTDSGDLLRLEPVK